MWWAVATSLAPSRSRQSWIPLRITLLAKPVRPDTGGPAPALFREAADLLLLRFSFTLVRRFTLLALHLTASLLDVTGSGLLVVALGIVPNAVYRLDRDNIAFADTSPSMLGQVDVLVRVTIHEKQEPTGFLFHGVLVLGPSLLFRLMAHTFTPSKSLMAEASSLISCGSAPMVAASFSAVLGLGLLAPLWAEATVERSRPLRLAHTVRETPASNRASRKLRILASVVSWTRRTCAPLPYVYALLCYGTSKETTAVVVRLVVRHIPTLGEHWWGVSNGVCKGYSAAMEAVIIGNPNSGSAGDEGYLERFAEILRDGGLPVRVLNTERPNHATELAAASSGKLVIAAGGDGTVNEVVNGLSRGATFGVLPLGTANVLARELGLPLDPQEACQKILIGSTSRMDVGVATDQEGAERRFALMAGVGFDAEVVRAVTPNIKRWLRWFAYPLTALKVYFQSKHKQPELLVKIEDTTYVTEFAVIANGQYYGGDFEIAEDTSLRSGNLEVILIRKVGFLLRADVLARILAKKPLDRAMQSVAAKEVTVGSSEKNSTRVPVQLDGEAWGSLPMSFHIEPAAINVIR